MKAINISDSRQRNSRVALENRPVPPRLTQAGPDGAPVLSVRLVKNTLETDFKSLTRECTPEQLSERLVKGDPEIDLELFGKCIRDSSRIYLNSDNRPAFGVKLKEVVHLADGSIKEERDFLDVEANINGDKPLKWSGKLLPKAECCRKFAFAAAYRISHVDGLTYDFLYGMAKELEEKQSMLYLAAGDKSNRPLVLSRNGTAYRGFLEGRTQGDKYRLVIHLTNLELKAAAQES